MVNKIWLSIFGPIGDWVTDTPTWVNTFLHWLILEAKARWEEIHWMLKDFDKDNKVFLNYYPEEREEAYDYIKKSETWFPELTHLYLEWRFPIPGRNTIDAKWSSNYMNDLERQWEILEHYLKNTDCKISIQDVDHKMTEEEELKLIELANWDKSRIKLFETALKPKAWRHLDRLWANVPFDIERLKEHWLPRVKAPYKTWQTNNDILDPSKILSYIGNNYEREEVIKRVLNPLTWVEITPEHPLWDVLDWREILSFVDFYWNWTKYPEKIKALREDWTFTNMNYHNRVTKEAMDYIYSNSLAVPLFAKQSYLDNWFMTPRYLEVINAGWIVIWMWDFYWIEKFVQPEMIIRYNEDKTDNNLEELIEKLASMSYEERKETYLRQFDFLDQFDHRKYYDRVILQI